MMSKNNKLSGHPILCQLISFIPKNIIDLAVSKYKSDYYYKTMSTYKQLVFILYGVITRCNSLQSLCKNLLFLDNKLLYLSIDKLPAVSTLSDANIKRNSNVFAEIYSLLCQHYQSFLSDSYLSLFINNEADPKKVKVFDATTISLFVDIFKAAGRSPINGKRKGGLKVQACLTLSSFVPDFICLMESAGNDRKFLGQLTPLAGTIYVFDKGYCNYQVFQQWTKDEVYFVTRLQDNASYEIVESTTYDIIDYAAGGVIKDEIILLQSNPMETPLKARLVTYKDVEGKVFRFLTNQFSYKGLTIARLYRNRWSIEVLFKQLKQNFQLNYFYSDNPEGIKTQIWIALIANLIFTVVHKQVKECEQFITMVSMASNNLGSYTCFITLLKAQKLTTTERNIKKMQLDLFNHKEGGVFQKLGKSP